ncbi:MAG: phosphatase PAP2 family protein [Planctomycetota bacterium]
MFRRGLLVVAAMLLAWALDIPAFHLFADTARTEAGAVVVSRDIEGNDWYRLLRIMGFAGTWAAVALVFWLIDRQNPPTRLAGPAHPRPGFRAVLVLVSVVTAGLLAELIKLLVGRERPVDGLTYQGFEFKPFLAAFTGDGGNLGFVSSHTSTAFAGAAAIALLHPQARPVLMLLAAGCGASRMLAGAHWLSDVVGGAIIGVWAARVVYERMGGPVAGGFVSDPRRTPG